jgi:serine protease Do
MSRRLALSAVPLAALLGGVAGGVLVLDGSHRAVAQDPAQLVRTENATASSLENAFMRVAETVGPATVSIEVLGPRPRARFPMDFFSDEPSTEPRPEAEPDVVVSGGSGLIIRDSGYILTNDHVVEGAASGKVQVRLADGQTFEGTVTRDRQSDLALVKIQPRRPLPTASFTDSDTLRVGQWAIAIGSPFGQQNSMTTGIVSALHRKTTIGSPRRERLYPSLIQTDAAINQGNSGGPLFNIRGEVIGVNVAIYSPSGTSAGIGFAIPANTAKFVADQLIAKGKVTRGFLGMVPDDINDQDRKLLGEAPTGVIVRQRTEGSPAAKAGIEPGDIITRFGEKAIVHEHELREAIALTPPGKSVTITLQRGKETKSLSVTLTEAPAQPLPPPTTPSVRSSLRTGLARFGLEVRPVSAEESKGFSLLPGAGVRVTKVEPDSPAAEAGITVGAILMSIGGTKISTAEAAEAALSRVKSREPVLIRTLQKSGGTIVSSARTLTAP